MRRRGIDMVAVIEHSKFLRILDSLNPLDKYVMFEFDEDKGFRVVLADETNNIFGELYVKMEAFKHFECGTIPLYRFRLDISRLKKELIAVWKGKEDDVIIEYNSEFRTATVSVGFITRNFKTFEAHGHHWDFSPSIEYETHFEIEQKAFKQGVKAVNDVTTVIGVGATKFGVKVFGDGDTDFVEVNYKDSDSGLELLDCGEDAKSFFIHEFLDKSIMAIHRSSLVRFSIGQDKPMRMVW